MTGARTGAAVRGGSGEPARKFRILFVSTGNVCRSPMAERIAGHRLSVALGTASAAFICESAGTWGHEGAHMEPFAAQLLAEHGAPVDGFAARELTVHQIAMADLVLAAAREHGEQVVALDPFAMRRTFTIREFARLAGRVGRDTSAPRDAVTRARALVERVADRRRLTLAQPADIADPYGAPLRSFRLCAAVIAEELSTLIDALAPAAQLGLADASSAGVPAFRV